MVPNSNKSFLARDGIDSITGIFAGMMEKGLLRRDDPAVLALSYTAPISALIHRCDREPEKIPDTMKEIETFSRHFIRTYGETRWFDPEDQSKPVIDPPSQIADKYPDMEIPVLPPRAVVFCLGRGLPILKEHYSCYSIMEKLPGFITHSEVLGIKGTPGICFLHGGYAAPQIACTIETLHVLGVKDICLIGLCGGFDERLSVGDVVLPGKIWSEEGTSRHYMESPGFAEVTPSDSFRGIFAFFREKGYQVFCEPTVTTDAVYRQTFEKEASWRGKGCVAVDMEASAFVNLCNIHGIKNTVILMVSDRHPIREEDSDWHWGTTGFGELTTKFILDTIAYLEEENHG